MRSRIRSIKPEALTHETLWDLEQETGLPLFRAFVGLWCHTDRAGRFEWRPRPLKAGILPYWDGDFEEILEALERGGFVRPYEVDGSSYGFIPGFDRHQMFNGKEPQSSLPPPPASVTKTTKKKRVRHASTTRKKRKPDKRDSTGGERVADAPIPSPSLSDPVPFPGSLSVPTKEGGPGGGGDLAAPLDPSWGPPFEEFVGVAFDRESYRVALEQFRAHHLARGTIATDASFRGRFATWATKVHQEESGRRSQRPRQRPRQPNTGADLSTFKGDQ